MEGLPWRSRITFSPRAPRQRRHQFGPQADGSAAADAIIYRGAFGASVAPAYSKNGVTVLMNCNVNGTAVLRTA